MKGFIEVTRGKDRVLINTWQIYTVEPYKEKGVISMSTSFGFTVEESYEKILKLIEEAQS